MIMDDDECGAVGGMSGRGYKYGDPALQVGESQI
jgi:hypothetical protein